MSPLFISPDLSFFARELVREDGGGGDRAPDLVTQPHHLAEMSPSLAVEEYAVAAAAAVAAMVVGVGVVVVAAAAAAASKLLQEVRKSRALLLLDDKLRPNRHWVSSDPP
jgi:hypothetical protein